jgi:AraC-like DNA-binding protein
VQAALQVIEERWAEPLPVRTLAQVVGAREFGLAQKFQREVGVSIHAYRVRTRLTRAAALLRHGVKVEAVALEVGYRSQKNFYRQFRRCYGTTPGAYRGVQKSK